jgi:hypothetical protein
MRVKVCAGIVGAALLLAGCSSSNELSAAGQGVRFVEDKPGSECQLLGTATGEQSNWMSGQHGEEAALCAARRTPCVTRRQRWAVT